jgi:hypothetical protein
MVDALRSLMLTGRTSLYSIGLDIAIMFEVTALLLMIGGRLCSRVAR